MHQLSKTPIIIGSSRQVTTFSMGVQWLSGRVLDSRPRGHGFEPHWRHCVVSLSKNIQRSLGFEPHWRHCVVSLSKNINSSLILVQPRKTHPFITEILLMGRKESNQTKQPFQTTMKLQFILSIIKFLIRH